ncbi:MAG: phosphoribosylanthranilate isomerase [Deltaproteobacteria bacterium]|nr:phosphoribosylanthranilate isomerase [Deltaproteobacteria bacterium]
MKGLIQIAGIRNQAEALMLVDAGVHQLGFPLKLTHHKEDLSEEDAGQIIRLIRPPASAVLITYLNRAADILMLCNAVGVCTVQLHGDITLSELRKLKSLARKLTVIKSLIVKDHNLQELKASVLKFGPCVDAFITDTFDPASGACGATGKTHNWDISRTLVEHTAKPVILAGGLHPGNVRKAILYVKPAGVDAHTGVEGPDGGKDISLVKSFVGEAIWAFSQLTPSVPFPDRLY